MSDLFFYFFALIMVIAASTVVLARNPLYNVLSLVLTIFSLSSIFVLLEAYFVGMILLLVYAGAVLIFFLFVVMCLNLNSENITSVEQNRFKLLGSLAGFSFASTIFFVIRSFIAAQALEPSTIRGTIENIGQILFTEYLLPFELTSFLLLVAVFGIVSLAQGAFNTGKETEQG